MNYAEAENYLKKISSLGSKPGLETIKTLLHKLGNPQNDLQVVHVAGTNGKGSIISFLQSILMKAGYRVGCYTSPAVFEKREIIKINNEYISKEQIAFFIEKVKNVCEQMVREGLNQPTVFEVETAVAFDYFKKEDCDICIIECGMGGALDATNVFDKVLCSVISTISLDHMSFLGNTIEQIAKQKAGIIKEHCPVVVSKQNEEVKNVIEKVADERDAELIFTDKAELIFAGEAELIFAEERQAEYIFAEGTKSDDEMQTRVLNCPVKYQSSKGNKYHVDMQMPGTYQLKNVATAIEAAETLDSQGFSVKDFICDGIKDALWQGRMEVVCPNPLIIIDGAHNPDAVSELRNTIDLYFTNKKIVFIMGVLADKDFEEEIKIIANRTEKIYTITPNHERALSGEKLAETISKHYSNVQFAKSVNSALNNVKNDISSGLADMAIAFGSLSYLGEIKDEIKRFF